MPAQQSDILPPLAIVGLSLKFPQDAMSPESFWDMIVQGRCAATEFPSDRLNIDAHYHPDPNRLDSLSVKQANFMKEDLSLFDAPFFSITTTEAEAMDPQQRLVLETSYRALENAGITMEKVSRSRTCVFTGSFGHDYETIQNKDLQAMSKFSATGTSMNMQSNRVSWFFNLNGPSATVDTACSSSLMAVDLTCQSIWSGDSTMGIAIGSNAILTLETGLILDNLGLMSPDGRCYSFDKRGNGYARGEGVGVLVIKTVNDAIRDGDTIRAVIRSSASNQDGRTPGITLPSMEMQETLIRDAYRKGGLDLADTRYFEAHGTGTAVGDPIESKAIGSIFRPFRSNEDPLYIGSVKSTIGHLEGAAGVAGLIKAVLALEKGIIPPQSTNFQSLNPRIDDEFLHIRIPSEPTPWPTNGLRRASVSSFGFGGSNSHVVLDDAYNFLRLRGLQGNHSSAGGPKKLLCLDHQASNTNGEMNGSSDAPKLLVWSSVDEKGITRIQDSWKSFLSDPTLIPDDKAQYLHDLSYTLGLRRTHFSWRSFVVARSFDDWAALPDNFASAARSLTSPNLALVFSGQGAQWHAMGRELLLAYPTFHESICSAGIYLKSIGCTWSALDELQKTESESNINKPEYSQTLTTAVQVALVDLLCSWDLVPQAVVGHSSGEIAAAYSAQAISRQSAWKIAFLRGKLSGWLAVNSRRTGTMLAIALTPEDACLRLEEINGQHPDSHMGIACVNSPKSLTISGDEQLIDILKAQLDEAEVFARKLKVGVAYHSHQMQEIAEEYRAALGVLEAPSDCNRNFHPEMVSSVTGTWVELSDLLRADYWVRNMVSPVLFLDALSTLCASSGEAEPAKKLDRSHRRHMPIHHLLEVGPHSVLQAPCKDILKSMKKEKTTTYLSMLVRNAHAVETALMAAGHLHCAGYPVDLSSVNINYIKGAKSLSNLPEYPFDRSKSYWHESQLSKSHRLRRFGRNDLLGFPDSNLNPLESRWRNFIRIHEIPWVEDHKVNETVLYPGMGMIVMAIEAAKQIAEPGKKIDGFVVKDAIFKAAIRVPSNTYGIETGFYMRPLQSADAKSTGTFAFRLCTFENQIWIENCTGTIQVVYSLEEDKGQDKRDAEVSRELFGEVLARYIAVQQEAVTPMEDGAIYPFTEKCGLCYGEAFQLVSSLAWHRDDENSVTSNVRNFSTGKETIHPTTLDAIIQTGLWPLTKWGTQAIPTMVPTQVDRLWVSHDHLAQLSSDVLRAHAIHSKDYQQGISASIVAFDEQLKQVVVRVTGLRMDVVSSAEVDITQTTTFNEQRCHEIEWKPDLSLLSNDEITNICINSVADQTGLDDFFTEVDFLLTAQILQTLRNIPSKLEPAQPHFTKYIDWMFEQKRRFDEGQVPYAFEPWRSRLDDEEYIKQVEDRVIVENSRGHLIASVARNLELFLTGELDPLGFLFQGDQMKNYYLEQLHDSTGLKRFSTYLDLLSHRNPQLRIVEVGAGTGSMTNFMLRSLGQDDKSQDLNGRRYAQWDYTDISRSFFGDAQDEFRAEGDRMRFRTLDIGLDPEGQGFEIGGYDVVVASLVLHATPDLRTTLTNARKLLKPGGKLILNEITATHVIRTAFVFGLLEGWWLSSEPYRKFGPCVDREKWHELLQETGFSGLDVALSDYEDDRCHENSVLVSSAVEEVATPAAQPTGGIEIIYDASEPRQKSFAQSLASLYHDRAGPHANCVSIDRNIEVFSDNNSLRIFILEALKPVLADMKPELFTKLQRLLCSTTDVLWVSSSAGTSFPHPHMGLSEGLFRVLAAEDNRKSCYLLSLEDNTNPEHQKSQITKVIEHLLSRGYESTVGQETEFLEQHGLLNIPRLVSSAPVNDRLATQISPKQQKMQKFKFASVPLKLDAVSSGLVSGFKFIEDHVASDPLGDDEIEIEVKAAGVNFRDVLIAVGQLSSPQTGFECSGVVVRTGTACERFAVGDRVTALAGGCFATYVRLKETAGVVKINPSVPFADAAAIPVNFATAYIALYDVARMRAGESILIHSAAGGTGQAAIQLAQNLGVTVYATVGSDEKRRFLREVYSIPESHIFSSRSTLFADAIRSRTNGRGVDAVFNSLAGESLRASWECIAPYGRFLEIGIKDILANDTLPMRQFLHNVSFSAINLACMMNDRPEMCAAALSSVFELIEQGKLRPAQELNLYGVGEMEKALRSMQTGRHIGKVVIEMREDDEVQTVLDTRPSTVLDPEATYVISGGLGGLGRNIALWLADRGARNLLLLSRSGSRTPKAQELVKELESRNVRVLSPSCDIADPDSLREALEAIQALGMPPVKGCIQAAMVLRDALFESMSHTFWTEALAPKVQGSWNLHQQLPSGMDFFIMLSSITGVFGSKGQANYAAGNTFQDALAAHRVALGEKATSIDLGLIGFTGAVVDDKRLQERLLSGDTVLTPIAEVEVHALLDLYCSPGPEIEAPSQITLHLTPNPSKASSDETPWLYKPLFSHLLSQSVTSMSTTNAETGNTPVVALLAQSITPDEASDAVIQALMARLSKALSIPMAELDANKPLHQYGVDSLVAVELRSWFAKEVKADVAVFDILGSATVESVGRLAAGKSALVREKLGGSK
ncbi:hypothetical protein BDW69DRAFT_183680 [Aspergillus filifer]